MKTKKILAPAFLVAVVTLLTIAGRVQADVVINVIETAGDVTATLSGNLDLNATLGFHMDFFAVDGYEADNGSIGYTTLAVDMYNVDFGAWTPFGSGAFGGWTTSSGDAWTMFGSAFVAVPDNYASGTALSATATKSASSFASLGFTPGSYVTTMTNGGVSDSVTVNIVSVPEPASLMVLGAIGLVAFGSRRRKLKL